MTADAKRTHVVFIVTIVLAILVHLLALVLLAYHWSSDDSQIMTVSLQARFSDINAARQLPSPQQTTTVQAQPEPPSEKQMQYESPVPVKEAQQDKLTSTQEQKPSSKPIHEKPVVTKKNSENKVAVKPTNKKSAKRPKQKKSKPKKQQKAVSDITKVQAMQATQLGDEQFNDYRKALFAWLTQHKKYSSRAEKRGLEGVVRLLIKIHSSGTVTSVTVTQSSGYYLLDQSAIESAINASPFPPIPTELKVKNYHFDVGLKFNIKD